MRPSVLLAQCAAFASFTAAQDAYLYTIDQNVHSASTLSTNSKTASSIIARRRGLTDSRYLNTADESTLQEISHYGGWQQPLFGDGPGEAPGRLFIRISGFDGSKDHLFSSSTPDTKEGVSIDVFLLDAAMPDLWIENPASDLQDDFKGNHHRQDGICEYKVPASVNTPTSKGVEVVFSYPVEGERPCLPDSDIPYIPLILSLHSVLPVDASTLPTAIGALTRVLRHFAATQNVESTILLLPSKLSSTKSHHHNHARAEPEETPLDLPSRTSLDPVKYTASNTSANFTLPSVVPLCFSSQSGCENTTNYCSGHGSCYKAHDRCYKCKCGTTLARYNADGTKKTVQWGGNACQKKDVSMPFILFASFGVAMTALIAGAIGMLYNMGSQELPSVIGAGVAGPTAHK